LEQVCIINQLRGDAEAKANHGAKVMRTTTTTALLSIYGVSMANKHDNSDSFEGMKLRLNMVMSQNVVRRSSVKRSSVVSFQGFQSPSVALHPGTYSYFRFQCQFSCSHRRSRNSIPAVLSVSHMVCMRIWILRHWWLWGNSVTIGYTTRRIQSLNTERGTFHFTGRSLDPTSRD
jgi:hypothetical protein